MPFVSVPFPFVAFMFVALTPSRANTSVEVTFLHKWDEPPIARYNLDDDPNEFYDNEVSWQDPITVTVTHNFALLPGPGRFLSAAVPGSRVPSNVSRQGRVYVLPIRASATLSNEGEKPVLRYVQRDS